MNRVGGWWLVVRKLREIGRQTYTAYGDIDLG